MGGYEAIGNNGTYDGEMDVWRGSMKAFSTGSVTEYVATKAIKSCKESEKFTITGTTAVLQC